MAVMKFACEEARYIFHDCHRAFLGIAVRRRVDIPCMRACCAQFKVPTATSAIITNGACCIVVYERLARVRCTELILTRSSRAAQMEWASIRPSLLVRC